jgi:AcrR family transcriptional regulator
MPRAGLDPDVVLRHAVKLVDRHGWHQLSMGALAADLGVKTPSLYNHVEGLAGLQQALTLHALDLLKDALLHATAGRSGEDAIRAQAHAHRAFIKAHPGLAVATVAAPPRAHALLQQKASAVVDVCVAALRGFQLNPTQNIHAVRGLRSSIHGFASMEAAGGFGLKVDVDQSFEWLVDCLVQGLEVLAERRRRPPP